MNKIKFKKITFNIQFVDGKKKEIDGYLFNIDGLTPDFVVHQNHNAHDVWDVSEYLTGAGVSIRSFKTRKQAVSSTIDRLQGLNDRLNLLIDKHPHVNEPLKEAIK